MDYETELKNLKRRVDHLEEAVSTLASQFRDIRPELASLQAETTRRFDASDSMMARIVNRLDTVNTQVWSLRDDLPLLLRRALAMTTTPPTNEQAD